MSIDIVDDLEHAEARIAEVEAALRDALGRMDAAIATIRYQRQDCDGPVEIVAGFRDAISAGQRVLFDAYCRASCHGTFDRPPNFTDERGTVWEGEACTDTCGCPCGHEGTKP